MRPCLFSDVPAPQVLRDIPLFSHLQRGANLFGGGRKAILIKWTNLRKMHRWLVSEKKEWLFT